MPTRKSKQPKRLAIVGFCNDSRELTPYEDEGLEIWGLNRAYIFMHRANRWFDMHGSHIYLNKMRRPGDHVGWLQRFPGPVYMHEVDPNIPNSVAYPLEKVAKKIGSKIFRVNEKHEETDTSGEPYLTSSIAQQIALAITEGYNEIHLYGIDLNTDSEYAWQKPGVEFLLGFAAGQGIKVVLPDNCPLLHGHIYGRGYLSPEGENMSLEQLDARRKALDQKQADIGRQLAQMVGAKRELEFIIDQMIPGLDQERLDQRRQRMQQAMNQFQEQLMQLQGSIKETAFWTSQTADGQNPAEAISQVKSNVEGPITELEVLQSSEPELGEESDGLHQS